MSAARIAPIFFLIFVLFSCTGPSKSEAINCFSSKEGSYIENRPLCLDSKKAAKDIENIRMHVKTYNSFSTAPLTEEQGLSGLLTSMNGIQIANVIPTDPWGSDYVFLNPKNDLDFDIISVGRDRKIGTDDDINLSNYQNYLKYELRR